MRRALRYGFGAVLLALVLAACPGTGGTDDAPPAPATTSDLPTITPPETPTWP